MLYGLSVPSVLKEQNYCYTVNKKNRSVGNLFYNVQKYRDGFGITRAVLFLFSQACSGQGAICDSSKKIRQIYFPKNLS